MSEILTISRSGPTNFAHMELYKEGIRLGLHAALGFRLSRVKSWECLPRLYGYFEDTLTSNESLFIVERFFYVARTKANEEYWALRPGVVDSYGIISKHRDIFEALSRCVLYPHVNIATNLTSRIKRIAENGHRPNDDVFELLSLFMQLAQQVEDAKTKDIVWLIMVSHVMRLHYSIYSSECPTLWINHLRNAVAHSQVLLVGCMITAYNLSTKGEKNWEMAVEVNVLKSILVDLFTDISATSSITARALGREPIAYGLERPEPPVHYVASSNGLVPAAAPTVTSLANAVGAVSLESKHSSG